jgi:hypothetical protein
MDAMTDLLSRPILRVRPPEPPPLRTGWSVAAVGTAAIALGGLLLCEGASAAGWFAADVGSFRQAMSVGALAWLLGNGAGLTGALPIGVVPLGLALLCALALYRLGRWTGLTCRVRSPQELGSAVAAMAVTYGAIGSVTALLSHFDGVYAPPVRTAVAFVALAVVFGGGGLLRGSGLASAPLAALPEELRAAFVGGLGGVLVMIAFSSLAFLLSLGYHFSTASTLAQGLHGGIVGGAILGVVNASLVPNAVLYAGAFLAGPGFTLGSGTSVSPGGIRLGLMPDLPVLAAMPTSSDSRWLAVLILLPVVAGGVAGVLAVRRFPVYGVDHAALRGSLAGLTGGVCFGVLTVAAAGGIGPGRLQHAGPDVLATIAVCAVAFLLGGVVAAVGGRLLGGAFSGLSGLGGRTRFLLSRSRRSGDGEPSDTDRGMGTSADAEATQPVSLADLPDD